MGTVHQLSADPDVTIAEAVRGYLAKLDHPEKVSTRRTYSRTYRALLAAVDPGTAVCDLTADTLSAWFTSRWAGAKPATWDTHRGALRSLLRYCEEQGLIVSAAGLSRGIEHRKLPDDRSRALARDEVEGLLTREDISLRERVLWRMLYETAARSAEVLRLDVGDLDLPNRRARVRRKGGAVDTVVWQTGTARLLPRLLKGRKSGPVFVTERKARVQLPASDLAPDGHARLSYQQAEALFKEASGGATLHQLRHSALTHDAEDGTGSPMLMARSGHTSVRSLAKYARVSAEALARHQAERDPARRR